MREMVVAQAQVGGHRKPTQLELMAARVAIQAMCTPTDAMVAAGLAAMNDCCDEQAVADAWRAMCDAALSEP